MSSLARATAIMSGGTVLSRITGVMRLAAIAAAIGAAETKLADTYNLANTAPIIVYELVLGGVLTSVFVPVFVELLEKEGRERAWRVVSAIINVSLVGLVALTTLGIIAAPWIAKLYATRLEGEAALHQQEVLTTLLRLMLPQIIFFGLAAMTAGLLNAHKRFGPPMYTPVLNNLAVIAVFVAFHQAYGLVGLEEVTDAQLLLIGLGTTAGVVLMAVAQLPFLRGLGRYRLTLSIAHPSVRKLARLSVLVIAYVITNQIGYLIVQWLANGQQGGYSAYVYAFIFFMLPHGLIAVSVMTALLPSLSANAVHGRWDDFRAQLGVGMRSTLFLVLPAAVGYLVLGDEIVRLLLERGVMTPRSTELIADVLSFFVIGLVPFSLFQLFLRAFYALHDTRTPFLVNCVSIALNIVVNIALFRVIQVKGLALGHAISYFCGATFLGVLLSRRIGGLEGRQFVDSGLRITGAAAAMGVGVAGTLWALEGTLDPKGTLALAVEVGLCLVVGVGVYLGSARLLRVPEMRFVTRAIRGRSGGADADTN